MTCGPEWNVLLWVLAVIAVLAILATIEWWLGVAMLAAVLIALMVAAYVESA